jgi:hypothetical protein
MVIVYTFIQINLINFSKTARGGPKLLSMLHNTSIGLTKCGGGGCPFKPITELN